MNGPRPEPLPYLLVDGALAKEAIADFPDGDGLPEWLHPVFAGEGALLGPLLIDIDRAVAQEQIEEMMKCANAMSPQLHVSVLEGPLAAADLARHLRQFSVIRTSEGQLFNLRFSDCLVLSMLEEVLSPAQWTSLTGPLLRWRVHNRDGSLRELQVAAPSESLLPTPLTLSDAQVNQLTELGAPDVMLAHIRDICHGESLPGTPSERHRWAIEARHLWAASGSTDELVLRWVTTAALDTRGGILSRVDLRTVLANTDREYIRSSLAVQVTGNEHCPVHKG